MFNKKTVAAVKVDKKTAIYNQAATIFANKGFANTTVDEIAAAAGLAKGTVYYHFKSKEELLFSLIEQGVEKFVVQIETRTAKAKDGAERLDALIEAQVDFFTEYRDFCRTMLSEIWRLESYWKQSSEKIQSKYLSVIHQVLNRVKREGAIKRSINTEAAAMALFGLVSVSSLDWLIFHPKMSRKVVLATMKEIFVHGIT